MFSDSTACYDCRPPVATQAAHQETALHANASPLESHLPATVTAKVLPISLQAHPVSSKAGCAPAAAGAAVNKHSILIGVSVLSRPVELSPQWPLPPLVYPIAELQVVNLDIS